MNARTQLERHAPAVLITCAVLIVSLLIGSLYLGPLNPDARPETHLRITEVMADNRTTLADDDGNYYSWVEIGNLGTLPVDLTDLTLTDDPKRPDRFSFPSYTLKSGEYVLVYLSGKNNESRPWYAPFDIKKDGDSVYLYRGEELLTSLSYTEGEPDRSFGLLNDVAVFFAAATPDKKNDGIAAPTLSELAQAMYTGIMISEVGAVSRNGDAAYPHDFVELFNTTDTTIDLSGYRLTEDPAQQGLVFDGVSLAPGEYRLFYCDNDGSTLTDGLCAPFSINQNGDELYLITPDGIICDSFSCGKQRYGVSSGRNGDDRLTRVFFETPTPGTANAQALAGYATIPSINRAGGYLEQENTVTLTIPSGCRVYYTTDGSVPNTHSAKYEAGTTISVNKTTVVRAIAYRDGYLPSDVVTQTFFADEPHNLPVVSVSANPSSLFGAHGVWTNFTSKDLEALAHTEYFSADGIKQMEFDSFLRLAGGLTRYNVQKGFSLNLNQAAGTSEIRYPLFSDTDVTTFSNLLLRPSGSDWNKGKLRDEFCARALKNADGQVIQSAQPVALYINGTYYGLYYLREKRNEEFIAAYTDIPAEYVQIAQQPSLTGMAGEHDADIEALIKYARTHDLTVEKHYNHVLSQIDATSLMQYFAYQTYFGNGDCINNIACFRDSRGGKWRWIIFDMDWACTSFYENRNFLQQLVDGSAYATFQNYHYPLLTALLKNENFREEFLLTYARLLQTTLSAERLIPILDTLAAEIEQEIPRQYDRFGAPSVNTWTRQVSYMRSFLEGRESTMIAQLKTAFSLTDNEWNDLYKQASKNDLVP